MMRSLYVLIFSFCLGFGVSGFAADGDTRAGEQLEETGQDIKKGTKKAYRNVKDKTCEWINGKMECAGENVKGKMGNTKDEVKDAVDAE